MTFFAFCPTFIILTYAVYYFWIHKYALKIQQWDFDRQVKKIQSNPKKPLPMDINTIKAWLQRDLSKDARFETHALPVTGESMSVHEWMVKIRSKNAVDVDYIEVYDNLLESEK